MNENPEAGDPPLTWSSLWPFVPLAISVIWLMGFGFSLLGGNDARGSVLKATACALSVAAGCSVFLLVWRPPRVDRIPWMLFFAPVLVFVEPGSLSWPFSSMLAYGVFVNGCIGLVCALLLRFLAYCRGRLQRRAERLAARPRRVQRPEPPPPIIHSDFEPAIREAGTR